MELGELKTFVTAAAEHSVSLAAMKLCRTQPAVRQAIRRLNDGRPYAVEVPVLSAGFCVLLPTRHPFANRHEGLEVNLSYVHGVGTTPLLADTIGGALNRAAERWGDCDALVACHQQLRYSYRELRDEADRAARALIALGVQRGDRVGIWSGNRAEWMITQYAAAKAGAILVNINPAYRLRELEYALSHSGVSVLITARGFRSTDYVDMLLGLMPELTATRTGPILAERLPALRHVVYLGTDAQPGGIAWADFLDLGNRIDAREFEAREATLQFDDPSTSSTPQGRQGRRKARRSRTTTF